MATTRHDLTSIVDIQSTAFAHQYQVSAYWARYGDEQGNGPQSDLYLIENITKHLEGGHFNELQSDWFPPSRFLPGNGPRWPLKSSDGRVVASFDHPVTLNEPNFNQHSQVRTNLLRRFIMDTLQTYTQGDNPDVIVIPITKGQYAIVDPEDADLANTKWFLSRDRYAMCRPQIDGRRPGILMHRVILERKLGRPILAKMVVDHINGNGLDNRRANLREATYEQNALNKEGRGIKQYIIPNSPSINNYILDKNNPNVVMIPLNQGKSALVDLIDIDLASVKWTLNCGRYANRRVEKNGKGTHYSMHRIILERKLGRLIAQGMVTDHINGNGLDNRRENLREATQGQNMRNLRLRSDNISQYKGVSCISVHTWEATINEQVIGYFDTALDASFAYDKAALEQYGEFAHLNNPLEQVLEWTPPVRQFGKKSASGYRGVQACGDRWGAEIKYNSQRRPLGFFDSAEEAAFAYDKAALELYGEKAQLNHPIEHVQAWTPPARLLRKTNTSGYRGVQKLGTNRWYAQIHAKRQVIYLGTFDTPEEAARAYDKAAREAFGEQALLNFPGEEP